MAKNNIMSTFPVDNYKNEHFYNWSMNRLSKRFTIKIKEIYNNDIASLEVKKNYTIMK